MERRGGEKQLPICAGKLCNTTCRCDGSDGSLFCQLNAFAKKQICPGKDEGCTTTMPMMRQTTVRIKQQGAGAVQVKCAATVQRWNKFINVWKLQSTICRTTTTTWRITAAIPRTNRQGEQEEKSLAEPHQAGRIFKCKSRHQYAEHTHPHTHTHPLQKHPPNWNRSWDLNPSPQLPP